jgi:hypothetical protein
MKRLGLLTVFIFVFLFKTAVAFTPNENTIYSASSPLANAEHPRLFVSKSSLPSLIAKIQRYYHSDFQKFVAHMDNLFNTPPLSGELDEWNHLFGVTRAFAFLYLVDPASIGGINAAHSRDDYGRKAVECALFIAQNLPNDWKEEHNGAKNLSTDEGGLASLALQIAYDWTFQITSVEERRQFADRLMMMWDNRYDNDKVKLENHYTANAHVYAGALCFFGDTDLGTSYAAKSQEMMDSFQKVFLVGQLGVAEKLYEGSSDWIEGDSYSLDAFTSIMLLAAAAESATGIQYFHNNPWLHDAPYFLYYNMMPKPYNGEYYYSQQNTGSVAAVRNSDTSQIWSIIAAMFADYDANLAGFAAWFCEQSNYGLAVENYQHYSSHLHDVFYKFLFGARHIQPRSPSEAGVPLSVHLGQMHAMRSDHRYDDATLIQFFSSKYWYENGHNESEQGSFNIHRFGPLAISAANSKNSGDLIPKVERNGKGYVLNNVLGLKDNDIELSVELGRVRAKDMDDPNYFQDGSPAQIGEVTAREMTPTYDYINYDYSRSYYGGYRTFLARRALVYLRGPVNNEYVVVMDRLDSSLEKYFVLHTPVDLQAVDGSWQSAGNGHWTSSARTFNVVNRINQAHGQMYLTSVFPQNTEMHKFGGPGYEWVWADGTRLDYDPNDFSEFASYILSDHTLQIRSQENHFLTVMQIGDANTMGAQAPVVSLEGPNWFGTLLNEERLVIFSKTENSLTELTYTISSQKSVAHLLTELKPNQAYSVMKGSSLLITAIASANGTLTFTDHPGGAAEYRIVPGTITSVSRNDAAAIPTEINLSNYPNPFNPATTINFSVPVQGHAKLAIYNAFGQLVRELLSQSLKAGAYNINWNGTDHSGIRVASGAYFLRLQINNLVTSRTLLLAK